MLRLRLTPIVGCLHGSLGFILLLAGTAAAAEYNQWLLQRDGAAQQVLQQATPLALPAALPEMHQLSYRQRPNFISDLTLAFTCRLPSAVPSIELTVPSLSVALMDSVRGFTFARFLVDNGTEYTLRGDIYPPARLVFSPITQSQEQHLSAIFLAAREGGSLQIALLQGERAAPLQYKFALQGFAQLADILQRDCQQLSAAAALPTDYLPDYVTREPEEAAPEDFSLKPLTADDPVPPPAASPSTPPPADDPPPILPFSPGGAPASIGADGLPIGAQSDPAEGVSAQDAPLGTASGPMAIGPDGMPQTN